MSSRPRGDLKPSPSRAMFLLICGVAISSLFGQEMVEAFSATPLQPLAKNNKGHKVCPRSIIISATASPLHASTTTTDENEQEISFDSLIDMDVVIYSKKDDESGTKLFGAVQEDGSLAPLSTWTTEPAFGDSLEFLVDEEDRFTLKPDQLRLHYMLQESEMSYGSRQCHRGVGNPHGEESELLYYVEQSVIDKFDVKFVVKPDLEILW